jgi:hypothetical protein
VDDPGVMRVIERGRDLGDDLLDQLERELGLALEARLQRLPLDQGHHEVEQGACVPGVEEGQDAGVVQLGEQADLAQEARRTEHRRVLALQDLEGDRAFRERVPALEHERHAAAADLLGHPIARKHRALQLLLQLVGVVAGPSEADGVTRAR